MARKVGSARRVDPTRFSMVPRSDVPRSAFDMQHTHKTTFNGGFLVPVYVDEVLPGDSFRVKMTAFARLSTPIVPLMDNIYLESFFFFVPHRLVWRNWTRFMGERLSPTDTTEFLVPQLTVGNSVMTVGSMFDYMGLTVNNHGSNTISVSALPFRAYNLIYNEWFRDQDLQDPVFIELGENPDNPSDYVVRRRGKRHDYFTTARPWPQKPINLSDSGVMGPIIPGGRMLFPQSGAPVTGIGVATGDSASSGTAIKETGARQYTYPGEFRSGTNILRVRAQGGFPDVRVLVNDIRTANAVQVLLERNARGGTRYTELVRSHFGVVSPDARLQRPEYLGGGRAPVSINPVAQTSATGATGTTTVLGELAGVGTAVASGHGFSASFTEHGTILGLVCVRADLTYQQGLNRMWLRRTQFDFYWPSLAHLGEQAILSKEIYSDGSAGDNDVFGYQERWAEYKYRPSRISGAFRSTRSQPLDIWHVAQRFNGRPVLNNTFIAENPPIDRVLQVSQNFGEQFLFDSHFDIRAVRCMPMYSIPGIGPRL